MSEQDVEAIALFLLIVTVVGAVVLAVKYLA